MTSSSDERCLVHPASVTKHLEKDIDIRKMDIAAINLEGVTSNDVDRLRGVEEEICEYIWRGDNFW